MLRTCLLCSQPLAVAAAQVAGAELVLTPNARAARELGVAAASVDSQAALVAVRAGLQVATPLQARWLLRAAVADVVGGPRPERLAAAMAGPLARLLRAGADLDSLVTDGRLSARARRLAAVGLACRTRLRQRNLLAAAELLPWAAGQVQPRPAVLVTGYAAFEPGQAAFLDALCGPASVIILPVADHELHRLNRDFAALLAARGWTVERRDAPPATPGERLAARLLDGATALLPGDLEALSFADPEAEARGVLARVKTLLDAGTPAADITVVVRDEPRFEPRLLAVAAEYEVPLRAARAVPLRDTRLGHWLELLAEALSQRFPYETTLRLLGQRWHQGLGEEALRLAQRRRADGPDAWRRAGAAIDPLLGLATPQPLAAWLDWLDTVLAPLGLAAWPREQRAREALDFALEEVRQAQPEPLDVDGFCALLGDVLDAVTVAGDEAQGVALHTPLALYGSRCRHVFVVGAAEGVLPQPVADDAVLDFRERDAWRTAGVPLETAAEAAAREQLSFWYLLHAVQQRLVISHSRTLDGEPALASDFLQRLGAPVDAAPLVTSVEEQRRAALAADLAQGDPVLTQAAAALELERARRTGWATSPDGRLPAPVPEPERFSATALTSLGQCPFRYFAGYLLRLEPPEEAAAEPQPLDRGSLYHDALTTFLAAAAQLQVLDDPTARHDLLELAYARACGEDLQGEPTFIAAILQAAQRHVLRPAEQERNLAHLRAAGHWPALREEWLAELQRAVAADSFLPAGATPVAFEQWVEGTWRGLAVHARIDRVDRLADGTQCVIDYKLGGTLPSGVPVEAGGKAQLDLQATLYRDLYPGAESAAYLLLRKGERKPPRAAEPEALERFVERIRETFTAGWFPVAPDADFAACRLCDYALVCRLRQGEA